MDAALEKARQLMELSDHLAEAGDRAGALKEIQEAIEIYEQLAEEDFSTYGPADLAESLSILCQIVWSRRTEPVLWKWSGGQG